MEILIQNFLLKNALRSTFIFLIILLLYRLITENEVINNGKILHPTRNQTVRTKYLSSILKYYEFIKFDCQLELNALSPYIILSFHIRNEGCIKRNFA